jgi:hypothetical protein
LAFSRKKTPSLSILFGTPGRPRKIPPKRRRKKGNRTPKLPWDESPPGFVKRPLASRGAGPKSPAPDNPASDAEIVSAKIETHARSAKTGRRKGIIEFPTPIKRLD